MFLSELKKINIAPKELCFESLNNELSWLLSKKLDSNCIVGRRAVIKGLCAEPFSISRGKSCSGISLQSVEQSTSGFFRRNSHMLLCFLFRQSQCLPCFRCNSLSFSNLVFEQTMQLSKYLLLLLLIACLLPILRTN